MPVVALRIPDNVPSTIPANVGVIALVVVVRFFELSVASRLVALIELLPKLTLPDPAFVDAIVPPICILSAQTATLAVAAVGGAAKYAV